jgi:hypothetical protein
VVMVVLQIARQQRRAGNMQLPPEKGAQSMSVVASEYDDRKDIVP